MMPTRCVDDARDASFPRGDAIVARASREDADALGRRRHTRARASRDSAEDASLASAFDALASRAGRGARGGTRDAARAGRGSAEKGAQTPILGLLTTPRMRGRNRGRHGGMRAQFDAL